MSDSRPPLVAHIIYALGTGGLENGLVNIINRSPPDRYRHAIICLTSAEDFAQRITAPGVRIIELNKKPGQDIGVYWRLWLALKELNPSIVHTRNLAALETQWLGVLMPGTKRVHGEHGRDIGDLDGRNWKYLALRKLMKLMVHRYIAVSQDLASWLTDVVRVNPNSMRQIYNGVDQDFFFPPIDSDSKKGLPSWFVSPGECIVLGTVGRLAEVKDQARVLEAMAIIFGKEPSLKDKIRLVMVGDGPLRSTLENQIERLDLGSHVLMTGDRSDIPQLMKTMDIFVLPSLAEGISNTVLEAMATGLPVVATRTGGNPELVSSEISGLLFPVGDSESLAEALLTLIASPQLRKGMGENALERIKMQFFWDNTVSEYLGVYDQLLGISFSGIVSNDNKNT
jgi:sugar transferase (PEP-CTERM/EpsH1 system associated)